MTLGLFKKIVVADRLVEAGCHEVSVGLRGVQARLRAPTAPRLDAVVRLRERARAAEGLANSTDAERRRVQVRNIELANAISSLRHARDELLRRGRGVRPLHDRGHVGRQRGEVDGGGLASPKSRLNLSAEDRAQISSMVSKGHFKDEAEAYAKAGADILFVESPESEEEMRRIGQSFDVPLVANMVEKGRTPVLTRPELEALGYKIAIFPVTALLAGVQAVALMGKVPTDRKTHV